MTDDNDVLFDKIELTEEEQQIFHKLKECHVQLQDKEMLLNKRDYWRSLWDIGGPFSFDLYTRLTSRGIEVKFNKNCLRNRSQYIGGGPEIAEFHNDIDVIKNIVSFIEFKHAHDEVGDVTIGFQFNLQIYCTRRLSSEGLWGPTPISFTRTTEGWKSTVWEKMSEDGKRCSQFLDNLKSVEACILPEISFLEDVFERLWNDAAEGMDPGRLREMLENIANWISSTERGKPEWI